MSCFIVHTKILSEDNISPSMLLCGDSLSLSVFIHICVLYTCDVCSHVCGYIYLCMYIDGPYVIKFPTLLL